MTRPALQKEHTRDRTLDRVQTNGQQTTQVVRQVAFLFGVQASAVFTAGQTLSIVHKLGRQPVGWFVTDSTGGAAVLERTAWDATSITFLSTNACNVQVWVF